MCDEVESTSKTILHTIRLNQAWRCESQGDLIVWKRNFGCPTGLDNGERVELVITNLRRDTSLRLNDQLLEHVTTRSANVCCDITNQLEPRNQLTLKSSADVNKENALKETPFNQIRLEIVASCCGE
jgi:hypothetical protein